MNLQQMRLEVRRAIDEITPNFWTDAEINAWLNEGAKLMCMSAQPLQATHQFMTVANKQEYPLPPDVDEIINVSIAAGGSVRNMQLVDPRYVQIGTSSTGAPESCYLRTLAQHLTDHAANNLQINQVNTLDPTTHAMVLGLYPVPGAAYPVTVQYFSRHFEMVGDAAVSPVPPEFHRGIIAFAVSLAKEKDGAYAEAKIYEQRFFDYSMRLKEKMQNQGQQQHFPKMRLTDELPFDSTGIVRIGEVG